MVEFGQSLSKCEAFLLKYFSSNRDLHHLLEFNYRKRWFCACMVFPSRFVATLKQSNISKDTVWENPKLLPNFEKSCQNVCWG